MGAPHRPRRRLLPWAAAAVVALNLASSSSVPMDGPPLERAPILQGSGRGTGTGPGHAATPAHDPPGHHDPPPGAADSDVAAPARSAPQVAAAPGPPATDRPIDPGERPAAGAEVTEPDRADFPPRRPTALRVEEEGRHGFISTCGFVRADTVDPIVFPGSTTKSHEHDFFGNTSTDEHTTTRSLVRAGRTTCQHADDLSAYWTPSAHQRGEKAAVLGTSMYYFTDKVSDRVAMRPMPVGLRMIAGDPAAREPQPPEVGWFEEHRNAGNNTRRSERMITARRSGEVTVRVNFPQCWNGTDLDSPDHRSHMAYVRDGVCPPGHPVLLPQLTMFVRFAAGGGDTFELASGPWHTLHADFWNAWHPDTFQELLERCRWRHCGRVRSR